MAAELQRIKSERSEQRFLAKMRSLQSLSFKCNLLKFLISWRVLAEAFQKLLIRCFNAECDLIVDRVSWKNISKSEERIKKSYRDISKLGTQLYCTQITEPYLKSKLSELRYAYECEVRSQEEWEEQRRLKAQLREELRARKEAEQAQEKAFDEECRYEKALKARADVEKASGAKLLKLENQVVELEELLTRLTRGLSGPNLGHS